jgi:hypothetical protein
VDRTALLCLRILHGSRFILRCLAWAGFLSFGAALLVVTSVAYPPFAHEERGNERLLEGAFICLAVALVLRFPRKIV